MYICVCMAYYVCVCMCVCAYRRNAYLVVRIRDYRVLCIAQCAV